MFFDQEKFYFAGFSFLFVLSEVAVLVQDMLLGQCELFVGVEDDLGK